MASSEDQALILVVDDEQSTAKGIADILIVEGYRVETVLSGRDALMKMRSQTPDLVLSDILMPEMDGYDFCTLVRATPEWRTLPFIFLTALGQKEDVRRGLALGADYYLIKPFEPDDLLLAVRGRLQRAADHQAATDSVLADLRTSILTTLNHELRIPLTYITGYSQMLVDEGPEMDADKFHLCVNSLRHGADRLTRLVENVLILTQIDSGELSTLIEMFPQQTTSVSDHVRTLIAAHQPEARMRGVELQSQFSSDLPPLAIGEDYFEQIIGHLLDNAIKFSGKGGKVSLVASCKDRTVELVVSDDGIGMRPAAQTWVFDSFRQVDRHKREQQGAGLGLAIVRGLVQVHGGTVSIESETDVGTSVKVQLPIAQDAPL